MTPPGRGQALEATWRACTEADWTGWDPYDGLMARRWPSSWLRRSRAGRLLLIQTMKRSPLNLRPLIDVPMLRNPKALALGLSGACRLAHLEEWRVRARFEARRLADDLVRLAVPTPSGLGWGYPFDWQARAFYLPRGTPTAVCTGFVVRALDCARVSLGDASLVGALRGAAEFVRRDLHRFEDAGGVCFSYSPLDRSCVINASLLGAETVARAAAATSDARLLDEIRPAVHWALGRQSAEGGWAYGEANHHRWEDGLHTGFNLISLLALRGSAEALGCDPEDLVPLTALRRGARHYSQNFFDADGRPWYYRHTPWPIDTHTAAVGVLTLHACSALLPGASEQAERVLSWTLRNLWSPRGRFVFQKHRFHTKGAPYLRWCEAWMLLALAESARSGAEPGTDLFSVAESARKSAVAGK